MFTIILSDDIYETEDAVTAFDIYSRGARAGDDPRIFRGQEMIELATECRECGEVVLMTYADTQAWLAAFGEDLNSVLCETCLSQALAQEDAIADLEQEMSFEREMLLYMSGLEQ